MRSVLAVGAHSGDIEAGCAATLAVHRAAGDSVTLLVLADPAPSAEAAARTLDCLLVKGKITDGEVRADAATIAAIENVITGVDADVIYVHAPDDSATDHRAAAAATLSSARHGGRVLHYPSPSTLRFEPSVFVDVSGHLDRKLAVVRDPEVASASARYFGALARVRYAEGFAPNRFVWDL
ncbi:MAG TPA: PIG-L family deacetylase [Actinoplanes sp.]|nr:PIG-L family deacetylase [Actinoplanes sp.]